MIIKNLSKKEISSLDNNEDFNDITFGGSYYDYIGLYSDNKLISVIEYDYNFDTEILVIRAIKTVDSLQKRGFMKTLIEELIDLIEPRKIKGYNVVSDGGAYIIQHAKKYLKER